MRWSSASNQRCPVRSKSVERMIERGERGRRLAISRFRLRQRRPDQRLESPDFIRVEQGGGSPHIRKSDTGTPERNSTQASRNAPKANPQGDPMLMRDAGQRLGERARRDRPSGAMISNMAQCIRPYVEVARWFKFAIRAAVASAISRARSTSPSGHSDDRQIDHRGDADVLAEAEGEIAIALRIENRDRLFEVRASLDEISR